MQRIAIIGAGHGGQSLVNILKENKSIEIAGICDINPLAPGMTEAERSGIKKFTDYQSMLEECRPLDLIISVTNDPLLDAELTQAKDSQTEMITGKTALFLWELVSEQIRVTQEAKQRMLELKDLYELGLKLSSSTDLREVYSTIIDYATSLTATPAGSISLLDEKNGEMTLAAAKGFSNDFFKFNRWQLRPGGLTSHILNQEFPIVIPDVNNLKEPVNPALAKEGVKSIIATPLTVRGKIIGILYVDDFKERDFRAGDATVLGLLSGYAALAIERMKLLDDTRRMAITDGLTGLRNQQEFLNRLEEEVSRAMRYGRPLSMVALDLDHFKSYNDEFGHLAGNDLLRAVAHMICDNCRVTDISARTGGEEFAIIMPETSYQEALQFAERLRKTTEKLYEKNRESLLRKVTVSIGVSTLPKHGESATELYRSVDQALYRAKDAGRNCVIGSGQPAATPAGSEKA